eukprot:6195297-Pleurochrysis_carterae.AAC.1
MRATVTVEAAAAEATNADGGVGFLRRRGGTEAGTEAAGSEAESTVVQPAMKAGTHSKQRHGLQVRRMIRSTIAVGHVGVSTSQPRLVQASNRTEVNWPRLRTTTKR